MGALNPLFLLAGLAVTVPLYLHLFHRHKTRRLSFPALRYLERTEREHARQIRLRQLLLLLARVTVLLLLVGAGARLFFAGRGASHPPTAVVIILDNSLSSGLVEGERRVLDGLKELAYATLDEATDDDRFWVIRAGEPWIPALPGGPEEARAAVEETGVSEAAGDLTAALTRARRLLDVAELPIREIQLLSDLQASAFTQPDAAPAGEVPVVVWSPPGPAPPNRALAGVTVGGGLPPLEGQRTQVSVAAMESPTADDTTRVPVRLVVNERIRGATTLPPGSEATIPMPPAGQGWILGYADADPDDLRVDDRRYFAFRSRPAPVVAVQGAPGVFVDEAVAVLSEAGRVRPGAPEEADLLVASNGAGLERRRPNGAVVVLPPSDATLLPALNRRLADAGIPWSFQAGDRSGEAEVSGGDLPEPLE
ncbi:MAG: BatA and WFA domain-containing protein, partial [Longimicrobiales bacterium]|nr:BatA and WFA domain-containing protein [Longimicrobiales bacterium]